MWEAVGGGMAEAKTNEEEAVSTGLAVQCQLWVSAEDPEAGLHT